MKERDIVLKIKSYLNALEKSHFFKFHGSAFGAAGVSDLIGVLEGRFIAIEVKMPGKEKNLTKLQALFLKTINSCGGIAFMATSLQEVRDELEIRRSGK